MAFLSPEGDLEKIFVDDFGMIDQYASTGSLWTWGRNTYGGLGDNTIADKSSPIQTIAGGTNWKQVAGGRYHTAAIKTDGTLWSWGRNTYGELGDNTIAHKSSPVQTIAGGTNWKQVACNRYHTAAIKTDGTLWLWGYNGYGGLGDNTIAHKSSPIQTIAGGTNWKLVACGVYRTAAIKTDGTLWLWGANWDGELGDNTIAHKSSPVQTIAGGTNWKLVASGWLHTAAIKTDGTLWTWGYNYYGTLGDNTIANKSSPVQTIAGGTNWKLVAGGRYHTAAIKTDGTLWLWGRNNYGQLGDNTRVSKSSPVQTIDDEGTNWKSVSGGTAHTAAIKTDGTLWLWGTNYYGTLGDETIIDKSSPIQTVAGGTNWKLVASGDYYTAAIKTDGTLWTWGRNNYGSLGDNTIAHKSSPIQTIAGGTNWKQVECGTDYIAAIKTDGTLWTWGANFYGMLGDNTDISKSSPVQTIAGGTNWKLIGGGMMHTVAIRDDS